MQMNKAAYGKMNHGDSVTSTAKYSDTFINGLAKGQCVYLESLKAMVSQTDIDGTHARVNLASKLLLNICSAGIAGYKRLYRLHSPDTGTKAVWLRTNDAYDILLLTHQPADLPTLHSCHPPPPQPTSLYTLSDTFTR